MVLLKKNPVMDLGLRIRSTLKRIRFQPLKSDRIRLRQGTVLVPMFNTNIMTRHNFGPFTKYFATMFCII
jgi:hypothetical protein